MKKRTILLVLLITVFLAILFITFNWILVRNTFVRAIKKQLRSDFFSQTVPENIPASDKKPENKFSFALITDIHNNVSGLNSTVKKINDSQSGFVVGLGDYTNVGTKEELSPVKKSLDNLAVKYYLLPGDHDLWNGRDKKDEPEIFYQEVFGIAPQPFSYHGVKFIFLNNADIYDGLTSLDISQFKKELNDSKESNIIIFSHKAIYHPLTIHRMGFINEIKNEKVYEQAEDILKSINSKKGSKITLFSGDLHSFSKYSVDTDNYEAYSIGALTKTKNFQSPRYSLVYIGTDGTVTVKDIPLQE